MGNCLSKKKLKKRQIVLIQSESDDEYKYSLPNKLSTIIEEKTIDINVTTDKI